MGYDINGTTLESDAGLIATQGDKEIMRMATNGTLQRYNLGQPMFRAGQSGTAAGGAGLGTSVWTPVVFNATNVNVGACYNTANGRFTAPVAGLYLVTGSTYGNVSTTGWYIHAVFGVNGSTAAGRPSGTLHRIHGYGIAGGYAFDTECFEIIPLNAGDYINFYNYSGGTPTHTPQYGRFEGYMLF